MKFDRLTNYFNSLISNNNTVGLDCAVFHKHKPVYRYMTGYADIDNNIPISESTIYAIYSATKVITCAAALMLYEKGCFLLSDPLYKYLPEFENMQIIDKAGNLRKAENKILIKDLFCMTAGFTYDLNSPSLNKFREDTKNLCPTRNMTAYLAKESLLFEPGSHYHYSLCHDVLAVLIEKITGQTYGQFLQDNVFKPLDMTDTFFTLSPENESRIAKVYKYNAKTNTMEKKSSEIKFKIGSQYESGGAGLYSSVNDYMKFNEAMCSDGVLLNKNTINLMRTNHLKENIIPDFAINNLDGYGYGLGVRTLIDKTKMGMNSPIGEFGGGGALGAHNIIDLENELTLFYAQSMNTPNYYVNNVFTNILYSCI